MRAFCTVSAPLEGCAPPATPLSPGSRFLALKLLGSLQPLYFLVEAKSRVREVYAQTCLHFAKQGMLDTELFGLAVLSGEWRVGPLGFFSYSAKRHSKDNGRSRRFLCGCYPLNPISSGMQQRWWERETKEEKATKEMEGEVQ